MIFVFLAAIISLVVGWLLGFETVWGLASVLLLFSLWALGAYSGFGVIVLLRERLLRPDEDSDVGFFWGALMFAGLIIGMTLGVFLASFISEGVSDWLGYATSYSFP